MKELNHLVLEKKPFVSVKVHLFFTKGHSDNPEGQVEVNPPQSEVAFEEFN